MPVLSGSAFKNKGVQPLLDAVVDFLPAPDRGAGDPGHEARTDRRADGAEVFQTTSPFSALAFKIMTDPFVGTLSFIRIYSGVLESGSYVMNTVKGTARAHRPHPGDARQ